MVVAVATKKKARAPKGPERGCTPHDLHDRLSAIIALELASIGAIDTATPAEREPGYVMLLRASKLAKQANVEQLSTVLRMMALDDMPKPSPIEPLLEMQSGGAVRLGTTPLLRSMRLSQLAIVSAYERYLGTFGGIVETGFEKCWRRARKLLLILTAHIAVRGAKPDVEELLALPMPLERYFIEGKPRVCFRCLFDREGKLPPIERTDPHPYQYVCGGCHEEVLADFPLDLLESAGTWSDHDRESLVVERALGRASKLKAELLIHNKLCGLAPEMPEPPMPWKEAAAFPLKRGRKAPDGVAIIDLENAAPDERRYIDLLFDYETVRNNW